jgi:hypothetical protein
MVIVHLKMLTASYPGIFLFQSNNIYNNLLFIKHNSGQLQAYQKYDSVLMIYNFFEKGIIIQTINN